MHYMIVVNLDIEDYTTDDAFKLKQEAGAVACGEGDRRYARLVCEADTPEEAVQIATAKVTAAGYRVESATCEQEVEPSAFPPLEEIDSTAD